MYFGNGFKEGSYRCNLFLFFLIYKHAKINSAQSHTNVRSVGVRVGVGVILLVEIVIFLCDRLAEGMHIHVRKDFLAILVLSFFRDLAANKEGRKTSRRCVKLFRQMGLNPSGVFFIEWLTRSPAPYHV